MRLAVTDANIFIDLIKLQLLHHLFSLDMEIHTSTEVVDQLKTEQYTQLIPFIRTNHLLIWNFDGEELAEIAGLDCPRALEFADRTVFYLAKKISATVLTGDGPLRKFCSANELAVRGILWFFDLLLLQGLINHHTAVEKMNHLLSFNSRLPKEECLSRLTEWESYNNLLGAQL